MVTSTLSKHFTLLGVKHSTASLCTVVEKLKSIKHCTWKAWDITVLQPQLLATLPAIKKFRVQQISTIQPSPTIQTGEYCSLSQHKPNHTTDSRGTHLWPQKKAALHLGPALSQGQLSRGLKVTDIPCHISFSTTSQAVTMLLPQISVLSFTPAARVRTQTPQGAPSSLGITPRTATVAVA